MSEKRAGRVGFGRLWPLLVGASLLLGARSQGPLPAPAPELEAGPACHAPPAPALEPAAAPAPWLDEEAALAEEAARLGIAAAIAQRRSGLGPRQSRRLGAAVVREARAHGLDPQLVAAVAIVESGFDPFAVSSQGARGVMQVMPATASWLEKRAVRPRELFDFERNLALGASYLASLIERFGRVDAALLAYNTGPTAARRLLRERRGTGSYAAKVLAEQRRLQERSAGMCSLPPSAPGG